LTVPLVNQWKEGLEKNKKARVAKLIGVPGEDDELFPEWDEWLKLEKEGGAATETVNGQKEESEPEAEAEDDESEEEEDE
jgi:coatomer subunit beta'